MGFSYKAEDWRAPSELNILVPAILDIVGESSAPHDARIEFGFEWPISGNG
jgi:hypothetical protein